MSGPPWKIFYHKMVEAQVASYRGPVWAKDTTWLEAMQSMNADVTGWPSPEEWK